MPASRLRIACVQHGDLRDSLERLKDGGAEVYGSQRYSVEAQFRMLEGHDHLIVSLEGPASDMSQGQGRFLTVPYPGPSWLPVRVRSELRQRQILQWLAEFRPTHILLRTNDLLGCAILRWANARRIPVAAMIASRFDPNHGPARRFCELANDPNVLFVGNHNKIATQTLIDCGLDPAKAIAWDYPVRVSPHELPAKEAPSTGPLKILFAGSVVVDKGVGDLVEAVRILRGGDREFRLTVCGEGPLRPALAADPGTQEGWLRVLGRVGQEEVVAHMRDSWVTVVPTRPVYPEAMPLVIIDSLASRTPVVLSDHPVFTAAFSAGKGVVISAAAAPAALAASLRALAADPARYRQLSAETAAVWDGLHVEETMHGLFERALRGFRERAAA